MEAKNSGSGKKLLIGCVVVFVVAIVCLVIAGAAIMFSGALLYSEGVSTIQNNSADTARRAAMQDTNAAIADYFTKTGVFPDTITFSGDELTVTGDKPGEVTMDGYSFEIPETGYLDEDRNYAGTTTSESTRWCYVPNLSDGYALAVELSSGRWAEAGTSSFNCEDAAN